MFHMNVNDALHVSTIKRQPRRKVCELSTYKEKSSDTARQTKQ